MDRMSQSNCVAAPAAAPCVVSLAQQVEKAAAFLAERLGVTSQFIVVTPANGQEASPTLGGIIGSLMSALDSLSLAAGHAGDIARKLGE